MQLSLNLFCFSPQGLHVVDQERIDQTMIDLDGTDNKCNYRLFHTLQKLQQYFNLLRLAGIREKLIWSWSFATS